MQVQDDHKGKQSIVLVFPHGDYCCVRSLPVMGPGFFIDGCNIDWASEDLTVPNGGHRPKFSLWNICAYVWGSLA